MSRISKNAAAQRLGRRLGHLSKNLIAGTLDLLVPLPENIPLEALRDVQRVLLVRPNFRIGNTLITSPLVLSLRQRFPGARLDYLSGDTTVSLLAHLPIDRIYGVSRRFILRPWQFVALFARLRRQHYDVAIEAGMGSFSGGMYAFLSGARFRVGCTGKGDRFLNVRLPPAAAEHAYDTPVLFARMLGADAVDRPVYVVSAEERARGVALLEELGLAANGEVRPFVAVFVGGHQNKRWPAEQWLELARALAEAGARLAVFLGPEETHFAARMRQGLGQAAVVILPQPLRLFGALWAEAALIVTPDSGPMHLAAALRVPTIAVLLNEGSLGYRPRGSEDLALVRPSVDDVVRAVTTHPRWREVARQRGVPAPSTLAGTEA